MNDKSTTRSPLWLVPNLLSLDAPLVAVCWMWVIAKSMRVVYVETYAYWLLAGAVWSIYVLDRVLDAKRYGGDVSEMSPRHQFHWKHWKILIFLVAGVVVYCGYSAFNVASSALLTAGVSGVGLVLLYILTRKFDGGDVAYAKNFVAAMTFSFGVSAPIVVESIQLQIGISDIWFHFSEHSDADFFLALRHGAANFLVMTASTVASVFAISSLPFLFGMLCFLNITAIDLWEKSRRSSEDDEKDACEAILGVGLLALAALAVYLLAFKLSEDERPFCYLVMVAAALLQLVNKNRAMFYLDAQRVLADLALILPLPLFWLLSGEALFALVGLF